MKLSKLIRTISLVVGVLVLGMVLAACGSSTKQSSDYKANLVESGKLTVGLEGTYPPYSYRQNGKLTGFEVELAQKIAEKLDLKANFVPTKWDGLIAGLGSNKYDMVVNNITQTPERKKNYLFSKPYVYSKYVLITAANNNAVKTTNDIKGKKFDEATGTDNAIVAKKFGATVVPVEQFQTQLDQIKQGRADGTINSQAAIATYAKDNSLKGLQYRVLTDKEQAPAKISALFNKQASALRDKVNKIIAQFEKDGTITKLSEKYFGQDVATK